MDAFDTKNEVVQAITQGIRSGRFKACNHLKYGGGSNAFSSNPYIIFCEHDSFQSNDYPTYHNAHESRCPQTCVFYVSKSEMEQQEHRVARRQELVTLSQSITHPILRVIAIPFTWFAKLSGIAQGMILLLIIVYFSPRIAESIIRVVKALK